MDDDIRFILEHTILAPSADNNQPWRFEIRGHTINIWNHLDRLDPFFIGTQGDVSCISIGAAIENMVVAATMRGFRSSVQYAPEPSMPLHIARVTLHKDERILPSPLFSAIEKRVTNRRAYSTEPLTRVQQDALRQAAKEFPCLPPIFILERPAIDTIARAASVFDKVLFSNRELHDYLFRMIRWSREEARSGPGFYYEALGVPSYSSYAFRLLGSWWFMRICIILGMHRMIAIHNRGVYRKTGALVLLTAADYSSESLLDIGRMLERMWLTATALGLQVQPLSGVPIWHTYLQSRTDRTFTKGQTKAIERSYARIACVANVQGKEIVMILRVGHGSPPSAHSARLPLDRMAVNYVLENDETAPSTETRD